MKKLVLLASAFILLLSGCSTQITTNSNTVNTSNDNSISLPEKKS